MALPRELTPEQRLELVQDFVRQEAGERHAWSFAIHNPKASIDGGEQPHAHIMMSQRVNDGIERTPEQYFRRYNARYPERGGAKKDSGSLTLTQQKEQLRELRKRWEVKHNEHMRKHGFERGFIDCRTLKEQGIERRPEVHLGSMKAFVILAESSSFNNAAKLLNITQPALTRRIKKMEEDLHIQLFERTTRKVTLT
ncbi:TPA: MobA/MobL family protein, partial [Escherichia coli]|nr:MobA/MobL family protein [Escherichia coli]